MTSCWRSAWALPAPPNTGLVPRPVLTARDLVAAEGRAADSSGGSGGREVHRRQHRHLRGAGPAVHRERSIRMVSGHPLATARSRRAAPPGLIGISYYLLDGSGQLAYYSYAAPAVRARPTRPFAALHATTRACPVHPAMDDLLPGDAIPGWLLPDDGAALARIARDRLARHLRERMAATHRSA